MVWAEKKNTGKTGNGKMVVYFNRPGTDDERVEVRRRCSHRAHLDLSGPLGKQCCWQVERVPKVEAMVGTIESEE